jgi:hypothetical protein
MTIAAFTDAQAMRLCRAVGQRIHAIEMSLFDPALARESIRADRAACNDLSRRVAKVELELLARKLARP